MSFSKSVSVIKHSIILSLCFLDHNWIVSSDKVILDRGTILFCILDVLFNNSVGTSILASSSNEELLYSSLSDYSKAYSDVEESFKYEIPLSLLESIFGSSASSLSQKNLTRIFSQF